MGRVQSILVQVFGPVCVLFRVVCGRLRAREPVWSRLPGGFVQTDLRAGPDYNALGSQAPGGCPEGFATKGRAPTVSPLVSQPGEVCEHN